ncbi:MAG: hypothetical protein AAF728_05040 [Cyanobacteria bacterium P01_D01_bin.128]
MQSGITRQRFKLIQSGFGETRSLRLFYYDGTVCVLMAQTSRIEAANAFRQELRG